MSLDGFQDADGAALCGGLNAACLSKEGAAFVREALRRAEQNVNTALKYQQNASIEKLFGQNAFIPRMTVIKQQSCRGIFRLPDCHIDHRLHFIVISNRVDRSF